MFGSVTKGLTKQISLHGMVYHLNTYKERSVLNIYHDSTLNIVIVLWPWGPQYPIKELQNGGTQVWGIVVTPL